MKTTTYNPSPLEVKFADAIEELKGQIESKLKDHKITKIDKNIGVDNPILRITMEDDDGDKHMVILKVIQKPDAMI